MSGSVNRVLLIGHLGGDPECTYTPSGQPNATFRLATNERWTDASGAKKEHTEWSRIVVWGKEAEQCRDFLRKGSMVCVEGKIRTRDFETKEGQKRTVTEVLASRVTFLDPKQRDGGGDE